MVDSSGQALQEGDAVVLLAEVIGIEEKGVVVRICNSTMQLLVSAHHDELRGGLVASSELTKVSTHSDA